MDFIPKSDKNKTPKSKIVGKVLSTVSTVSPLTNFPKFSTPPSRYVKIFNPFESTLIERLHLPTFSGSPSVFNPIINEEKFKWDIEDISRFKPADIDETTINQHVDEVDPHVESIVQQKINKFFSEKVIVPSPLNIEIKSSIKTVKKTGALVKSKNFSDGAVQTLLSLPPHLPNEVEEVLKPYFNCSEHHKSCLDDNLSLHKKLFEVQTPESECNVSRIFSDTLSPISSVPVPLQEKNNLSHCPSELDDCGLSPISTKSNRLSKSACKLDFSTKMSVDTSIIESNMKDYEDINNLQNISDNCDIDMEYKQLSSSQSSTDSDKMDVSNSNTPHSKLFSSQRKRLSESFKEEESKEINCFKTEESIRKYRRQLSNEENTDLGYLTGSTSDDLNFNMHVFASTPSKKHF